MARVALIAAILLAAPPVLAQTVYLDQVGRPAVKVNPGEVVTFEYGNSSDGQRQLNSVRTDACGLLVLDRRNQKAQIQEVDGLVQYFGNPPTQVRLLPECVNGQLSEPRIDPFLTPDGRVVLPLQPNTNYFLLPERFRRIRANACGLATPTQNERYPFNPQNYKVNDGPSVNVNTSPTYLPYLPFCRQDTLYFPIPSQTP